jgi:hypothetical protein
MEKKDKFYAKTSFILSLGFWIPLFNIGMAVTSIIFAFKALKLINKDKNKYGGKNYAIIGLIIGFTVLITSIVTLAVFTYHKIQNPDASFFPTVMNLTGT